MSNDKSGELGFSIMVSSPEKARKGFTGHSAASSNLVGSDGLTAPQRDPLRHVGAIEIADTVVADLAVACEPLEALERLGERDRAAPMQQVEVDPVGTEPFEAALARCDHPSA